MNIYSVCILHESGVPLYWQHFSEEFQQIDFTLVSSFFSAIMNFSEQVIHSTINILDLGKYRFFVTKQNSVVAYLITDTTTSGLLITERLERMMQAFFEMVSIPLILNSNHLYENSILSERLNMIVQLKDDYSRYNIEKIKSIFDREMAANDCKAGALISLKGEIFYSSLPLEELQASLKEIELRTKLEAALLLQNPKFISQTGEKIVFAQCVDLNPFNTPVYIVLLFGTNSSLGMADFALEDIIKKLKQLN